MYPPLRQFRLQGDPLLYLVGLVTLLAMVVPVNYVYTDATIRNDENATLWAGASPRCPPQLRQVW